MVSGGWAGVLPAALPLGPPPPHVVFVCSSGHGFVPSLGSAMHLVVQLFKGTWLTGAGCRADGEENADAAHTQE